MKLKLQAIIWTRKSKIEWSEKIKGVANSPSSSGRSKHSSPNLSSVRIWISLLWKAWNDQYASEDTRIEREKEWEEFDYLGFLFWWKKKNKRERWDFCLGGWMEWKLRKWESEWVTCGTTGIWGPLPDSQLSKRLAHKHPPTTYSSIPNNRGDKRTCPLV